jgi:hypothetical protein
MPKFKYIFPNFMADFMSKLSLRVQYEATMMSMSLISVGLVISVFYVVLYTDFETWYKVVIIVNGIAGIGFLSSFLVTTYQQYLSYMEVADFQKELKGGNEECQK